MSLLEAIRKKYASESLGDYELHAAQQIQWGSKVVEEIGFEKIRQQQAMLKELRIILVDGLCVQGITSQTHRQIGKKKVLELKNIQATCRQVVELDISQNLLKSWPEIIEICNQIDSLISLRAK